MGRKPPPDVHWTPGSPCNTGVLRPVSRAGLPPARVAAAPATRATDLARSRECCCPDQDEGQDRETGTFAPGSRRTSCGMRRRRGSQYGEPLAAQVELVRLPQPTGTPTREAKKMYRLPAVRAMGTRNTPIGRVDESRSLAVEGRSMPYRGTSIPSTRTVHRLLGAWPGVEVGAHENPAPKRREPAPPRGPSFPATQLAVVLETHRPGCEEGRHKRIRGPGPLGHTTAAQDSALPPHCVSRPEGPAAPFLLSREHSRGRRSVKCERLRPGTPGHAATASQFGNSQPGLGHSAGLVSTARSVDAAIDPA